MLWELSILRAFSGFNSFSTSHTEQTYISDPKWFLPRYLGKPQKGPFSYWFGHLKLEKNPQKMWPLSSKGGGEDLGKDFLVIAIFKGGKQPPIIELRLNLTNILLIPIKEATKGQ